MFNLVVLRVDATSGTSREERFLTFATQIERLIGYVSNCSNFRGVLTTFVKDRGEHACDSVKI